MNENLNCRFLTTAQTLSDEDITPAELQQQLQEFITEAKALLCGNPYFLVADTLDSLIMAFDKVLARKKKALLPMPSRMPVTKWSSTRTTTRSA